MNKEQAKKYIKGRCIEIMYESEVATTDKNREKLNIEFVFLHYVNNVLDYIEDECDDIPPNKIFKEYKGYVLRQSNYNNHYIIFKDNHLVTHCQCKEKLDQKGAEEAIDFYLSLIEKGKKENE